MTPFSPTLARMTVPGVARKGSVARASGVRSRRQGKNAHYESVSSWPLGEDLGPVQDLGSGWSLSQPCCTRSHRGGTHVTPTLTALSPVFHHLVGGHQVDGQRRPPQAVEADSMGSYASWMLLAHYTLLVPRPSPATIQAAGC